MTWGYTKLETAWFYLIYNNKKQLKLILFIFSSNNNKAQTCVIAWILKMVLNMFKLPSVLLFHENYIVLIITYYYKPLQFKCVCFSILGQRVYIIGLYKPSHYRYRSVPIAFEYFNDMQAWKGVHIFYTEKVSTIYNFNI